jgi:SAM-dependent methyltransferase
MSERPSVQRATYFGLALVTLSTLMLQLLLTRIFSVTMWYHFAFLVISMSMFGLTAGALIVHLWPRTFPDERLGRLLAGSSLAFALTTAASFALHLWTASVTRMGETLGSVAWFLALTFSIISIPFVCSGICVCLTLTRFPRQVARLYAADLVGAGLGCVVLIQLLDWLDGPSAVLAVAAFAAAGSWCFAHASCDRRLRAAGALATLALGGLAVGHGVLSERQTPLLRLSWVEEKRGLRTILEKWNAFSYLRVTGTPRRRSPPFGWGMSPAWDDRQLVRQAAVGIDAWASTVITHYRGDPDSVDFLRWDVTNIVHHLSDDANVLVVGSGGGRDVLSALAFDQRSVRAVEINEDLISLLTERFGAFSGHLDADPRVDFVNDEARSYLARTQSRYGVIQISMIDTWAATAAGAFTLTENALYTREAFRLFLDRLEADGVLSVSRWYRAGRPAEVYRLLALAADALSANGAPDPRQHLLMVRSGGGSRGGPEVATLLVGRGPFDASQLARFEEAASELRFPVLLTPAFAADPVLERIADAHDLDQFTASFPVDITPPTDDRPFFFLTLRLKNLLGDVDEAEWVDLNVKAVAVLGAAILVVTVFATLCVAVPIVFRGRGGSVRGHGSWFGFFAAVGLGFMLVEMSQVQRLSLYLGHPTYGLAVVLSSLLVSSGVGSFLSQRVGLGREPRALAALLIALVVFGAATPGAIRFFAEATIPVRLSLAVVLLAPIGGFMGTAFPLGMRLVARHVPDLSAWLWGINGAASVWASVVGVAIALMLGISFSFWMGVACYAFAWTAMRRMSAIRLDPS